jgi:hypothetical protein
MFKSLFFEVHLAFAIAGIWQILISEKEKLSAQDYITITFLGLSASIATPISLTLNLFEKKMEFDIWYLGICLIVTHLFLILAITAQMLKRNPVLAIIALLFYTTFSSFMAWNTLSYGKITETKQQTQVSEK